MNLRFVSARLGSFLRIATAAALLTSAGMSGAQAAQADAMATAPMTLVELHWLKPGVDPARAVEYIDKTEPIAQRHKAQILDVYRVAGTLKGKLDPAFVWVYRFQDRSLMPNLGSDPAYQANLALRDATWDFGRNQLYAVKGLLEPEGQIKAKAGWLNFVELHWATDTKAAEDYVRWVRPLAQKHGGEVAQVFKVEARMKGEVEPQYIWIYRFPHEQAMKGLMTDPEYVAAIPSRNRIWDFERNQLLAVTPRGGAQK